MDYLVTGGAGFIGSNIVMRLVADGQRVRVLDNLATGRLENLQAVLQDIEFVEGDLRDAAVVTAAVKQTRNVLHLGALPSVARSVEDPATSNEVNIAGTLNVLLAAKAAAVERVVFSSSSSVYGDTAVLPKHEDLSPMPLSPYALQKLTGEYYGCMFSRLYGLPVFCLRYFNVFGPNQNPDSQYSAVIPLFISALLAGRSPQIHGDGGQTRDFTYVDDVVEANLCCCRAPLSAAGQAYNVARGDRISVKKMALTLQSLMNVEIPLEYGPARPGDVRDSQADSSRARTQLGWAPQVPFADGLQRTVEYFQARFREGR